MLNEESFLAILDRLLEKSKQDKVNWLRRSRDSNDFYVIFKDGTEIEIAFYSPPSEPDYVSAELITKGEPVYLIRAEDGYPNYARIRPLYEDAFRRVTGWDSAMKQIEQELSGDSEIGTPF